MGKCKYCGKEAGLMRATHKECELRNEQAAGEILHSLAQAADGIAAPVVVDQQIRQLAVDSYISSASLSSLILQAYEAAVDRALDDGLLSEKENARLSEYRTHFEVAVPDLGRSEAHIRLVKAEILKEVLSGEVSNHLVINGSLPFNFQKSEQLVWLFQDCQYHQPRTRTAYQGQSSGVSFRVMKGVYYRVGEFRGNPVVTTQIVQLDTGMLAVTTKNVYFAGDLKSVRVPYSKVISFKPYSDAIGIQRDGVQKGDIFVTGDGWFTYNLITNLANQASP